MSDRDKYPSELAERFQVRMPEGMREQLRTAAIDNERSMNAEIVHRIDRSFSEWPRVELPVELVERAMLASVQEREGFELALRSHAMSIFSAHFPDAEDIVDKVIGALWDAILKSGIANKEDSLFQAVEPMIALLREIGVPSKSGVLREHYDLKKDYKARMAEYERKAIAEAHEMKIRRRSDPK